jgi:hypothetical protein
MKQLGFPVIIVIGCVFLLALNECVLLAQVSPFPVNQTAQVSQPIAVLSPAQLEGLVSPIALYPDPLLSQVLVASSYPLEVVAAAQWLRQNPSLTGAAAQSAASRQNWDPSVQALVLFPDVLFRMSDNIQWTSDLGNAFLAQQAGVMDAVQRLRTQATATGKLASNPEMTVTTEVQDNSSVVEILPANSEIIYVPAYDPELIWGLPFYPYPIVPYGSFLYGSRFLGYSSCIFVGRLFGGWHGWGGWGWHPNWFGRSVLVNNYFFARYGYNRFGVALGPGLGAAVWTHNPVHRANVPYSNPAVAAQFQSNYRGAMTGRVQAQFGPSTSVPLTNSSRPASPIYGPTRPTIGSAFVHSRPIEAPQGNFKASRTPPARNFSSAPAPSFHSMPSYGRAPSVGGGKSAGRSGGGGGRSGGGGHGGGRR